MQGRRKKRNKIDNQIRKSMKKGTWRKQHKWLGIGLNFFMLMFCVSGILLNHRSLIKEVNVSRKYLPSRYEFQKWNGGLLRGTLDIGKDLMVDSMRNVDSCRQLLLYGNGASGLPTPRLPTSRISMRGCQKVQTIVKSKMS